MSQAMEAYNTIAESHTNDDLVLYCALQLRDQLARREQGLSSVHLLTDDRNLRVKAQADDLGALGFSDAPCSVQQARLFML